MSNKPTWVDTDLINSKPPAEWNHRPVCLLTNNISTCRCLWKAISQIMYQPKVVVYGLDDWNFIVCFNQQTNLIDIPRLSMGGVATQLGLATLRGWPATQPTGRGGGGRIISCSHWKATSKRFIQRPWNVFIASSGFICLPAAGQIPFWRNLWRPLQKVDIRDWIHSARCYYALAAIRQSFHPIAVATDKRNVEHATAMTHFRVDDGFLSAATFFFGFGACLTDLGR